MPKSTPLTEINSRQLYLRLLSHVKPYWRVFSLGIVGMVIAAMTEPAIPALMKPLLDGSFVDKDPFFITWMPVALVAVYILRGLANYAATIALAWVGNKVVMDLRLNMFKRLLSLPVSYYDDNPSGNIISKLTYNVTQVTNAASRVLTTIIKDGLSIIGLLGLMLYIDWKLTLITLAALPVIVVIVAVFGRRMRRLNRELQNAYGDMTHILEESIRGNKLVKIFGGQQYEFGRFHHIANFLRHFQMKVESTAALNGPFVQVVSAVAMGLIIYIAASKTGSEEFSVGTFVSFITAMGLLLSPMKRLTGINEQLQRGLAAAETIFALIDEMPEEDRGKKAPAGRARGELCFDDVSFAYDSGSSEALKQVNFTVQPGQTVALVGPSGSGKTTIANLMARFYHNSGGRILLDGQDIRDMPLKDLRRNLSLVPQDIVLFNDTVAANIAYGIQPAPPEEDIIRAAEAAYATEFINDLPEGMDTLLGDNGVRLSGGQRQRLAIARALLKDPPVLLLDEATAALDTQSEKHVQAALETLKKGRSTLIIAHRLSTIENADHILVLKDGEIIEQGCHEELLESKGFYHDLYFNEQTPESGQQED